MVTVVSLKRMYRASTSRSKNIYIFGIASVSSSRMIRKDAFVFNSCLAYKQACHQIDDLV